MFDTPTFEQANRMLRYDQHTGFLFWRVDRPNGVKAGDRAGSVRKDGYRYISLYGKRYYAQQIAWLLHEGEPAGGIVDHRNRQRDHNERQNLRKATRSQNGHNSKNRADNTSGHRGIRREAGKWRVRITVDGVRISVGMFDTIADAVEARKEAERKNRLARFSNGA